MHSQLCWTVASMVVLDSKSIADAMVCACRKLLRDLSVENLWSYTARTYSRGNNEGSVTNLLQTSFYGLLYGTLGYFKQNKLPYRSGKWRQTLGWAKTPNYPNIKNVYFSTKSPRNIPNTSFYTNLGLMNPFLVFLWWLRVKKCTKQRWPPRPLIQLCIHKQNIVQHYKIHELWLIYLQGIHFWRLFQATRWELPVVIFSAAISGVSRVGLKGGFRTSQM